MAGIMSIGRSRAKVYTTEKPKTTFADVAGYKGVKQEINEVVDFLKQPKKFHDIGARIPKGVLLVGPPGHRQDPHRPGGGGRGRRAVHVDHRLRLHGDVRRRGRGPGPRPVPVGPQAGPLHHLRGRDRLHRPQARRRARRRPRRAGADAQPDALGDGRVRDHRGRRHDGGHQPARHPRPGPAPSRPLRPPDRRPPARPRGAAAHPPGPLQGQAPGRRRRPPGHRPGHARHERCRPGQPGQRGRPPRGAAGRKEIHMEDFESARDRVLMGQRRESMALSDERRRSSPTTRVATRWPPTCSSTPTPCTRSPSSPRAWPWASPSSCPSRSATSTRCPTSRTRWWSAWVGASPRSSSSG